jgi:hypothetical protein
MMDISSAANIAEIAGGIAILVSLVYVGYQVRQSNRIASASALQSVLDRYADRNIDQFMESAEIKDLEELLVRGHHSLDNLSRKEGSFFHAWILREIFHMQNIMQLHRRGLLNDIDYQTWLAFTAAVLKTPGGQACWDNQTVSLTPTIVETIETYMKENPQAPSLIQLYPQIYGENGDLASKGGPIG